MRNSRGNWSCPRQNIEPASIRGRTPAFGSIYRPDEQGLNLDSGRPESLRTTTHCGRANAADRPPDSRRALDRPFQFQYIVGMASKTIETRAHTTKDGRLNLSVDVDIADVDVAVVVTVTPVAAGSPVDENGWPEGFFDHVAGSMPGLRRASQGDFEERLPIE